MNEYVRYENMRYEMAECAEVVRRVLGLTVPVSIKDLNVQSVFAAADILRHFLYVKDILHIVYVKHKERKKENVK